MGLKLTESKKQMQSKINNKSNIALAAMFLFIALAINVESVILSRLHISLSLIMALFAFHFLTQNKDTEHE